MKLQNDLTTKQIILHGRACLLRTTAHDITNWRTRPLYLFISLKNRKFTKDLILWFVDVCDHFATPGTICVVDEPYLFNLKAKLGCDVLPRSEVAKLKQIAWEIRRKAQKAIRARRSTRVSLRSWQQLSRATPGWMKAEVTNAFEKRGKFYRQVLAQVKLAKGNHHPIKRLEQYAGFFLCEVPVLIYAYYAAAQGLVDVYPGENAEVLWRIELGEFRDELPRTTAFALAGPKLIYVNVLSD